MAKTDGGQSWTKHAVLPFQRKWQICKRSFTSNVFFLEKQIVRTGPLQVFVVCIVRACITNNYHSAIYSTGVRRSNPNFQLSSEYVSTRFQQPNSSNTQFTRS